MRIILGFAMLLLLLSCNSTPNELSAKDQEKYLSMGDSIATHAQKVLLQNVSNAVKEKGTAGAVDFCNEKAIVLTDSVSKLYAAHIQRLSDKNRNPQNALVNNIDKEAWTNIEGQMSNKDATAKQWLKQEGKEVYYYKAIPIGMPTCLSCHGNKGTDIDDNTFKAISEKYSDDKATGYQMGQLRGIWKIKLSL